MCLCHWRVELLAVSSVSSSPSSSSSSSSSTSSKSDSPSASGASRNRLRGAPCCPSSAVERLEDGAVVQSSCLLAADVCAVVASLNSLGRSSQSRLLTRKSWRPGGRLRAAVTSRCGGTIFRRTEQQRNWSEVEYEHALTSFMPVRAAVDETIGYSSLPRRPLNTTPKYTHNYKHHHCDHHLHQ